MEAKYSKWRKLDNAALAFPMVTGKDDTRVFRFYCELKETVDETTLQEALDQTMKTYPLFQAVLRKGLFWFYLEHREIRPVVREETKPPCSRLYIPDKKSLLFEVTYYQNRISCADRRYGSDAFSAGTGAELPDPAASFRGSAAHRYDEGDDARRAGGRQLFSVLFVEGTAG